LTLHVSSSEFLKGLGFVFRVWCLGLRNQGLTKVRGLGLGVKGLGILDQGSGFIVWVFGLGFRV
jgi:hypothetical protein